LIFYQPSVPFGAYQNHVVLVVFFGAKGSGGIGGNGSIAPAAAAGGACD